MRYKRFSVAVVLALIAGTFTVASATLGDTAGDPSDLPGSVQPILVPDNPNCATLNASSDPVYAGITQDWGFKLEGSPSGTFPLDESNGGELTGGAASDPLNSVTVTTNASNTFFDWAATLGIDAVIVKAGDNANAYVYTPESFADGDLHAPEDTNGNPRTISHIEFCFDDDGTPEEPPADTHLTVVKFYDANANGLSDPGEPTLPDWKINISPVPGDTFTPFDQDVEPGDYTVFEYPSTIGNWVATTATTVGPFTLNEGDSELVEFGNVCLGAGGGRTLGFWSNKNGQKLIDADDLSDLTALNLRNPDGSHFVASDAGAVKKFLLSGSATNMANMLSVQLAAMTLNVNEGFVDPSDLIFLDPGFATVFDVMADANDALAGAGNLVVLGGDPARAGMEVLKNALDDANNNLNFVQSEPCGFSFEEQASLTVQKNAKKHKRHRHGRGGRGR